MTWNSPNATASAAVARATARRRSMSLVLATLTLLSLSNIATAETREFSLEGDALTLVNLIGEIEVVRGTSRDFKVRATVRGKDADRAGIDFQAADSGRARFVVAFPVDRYTRYVYPEYRGRTTIAKKYNESGSVLSKLLGMLGSDNVRVEGSGSGLEVWVDVLVEVPVDSELAVENGVGDITVQDVRGKLNVRTRAGRLTGNSLRGDSVFDLGSGAVRLADVQGRLLVDTGSGSVSLDQFDGPSLSVDTGSGGVTLNQVRTRELVVDTGSGGVDASAVSADQAHIDTGSGSVLLALAEMGSGDFSIDTGSGGITLLLPDYASALVNAETGSGGVQVALDDVRLLHRERNEMRFKVGKGAATVDLDTGSGAIRIAPVDR